MMCKTLLLCLLLHVAASEHHQHDASSSTSSSESGQSSEEVGRDVPFPRVVTPSGAIRGSWMETRKGRRFQAYRGVRYAEAPVGELRFQPPKPVLSYKKEFDASKEGPACPTIADEYYYANFSEDCLRLNVYSPLGADKNSSLPVVVFIHAGGFYSMSGRSDLAGPHYLLDRDLVLVTINYRLGSLGFLSTGDALAPGNNGMKDQVVALRWVQRNIGSFGGDPRQVTLAGCSAGSISVMLHMISPMSKGLFHRGISMSGSPTGVAPLPRHTRRVSVTQATLLGCPANTTSEMIDCLQTKTWRQIGDSLLGFYEFGFDPVLIWQPVVEPDFGQERFLTVDPADAIRSGAMHAVPHIISQTRDEFYWKAFTILRNSTLRTEMNSRWREVAPISFQLPRDRDNSEATDKLRQAYLQDKPLQDDAASADGLGKLYGDSIIGFPVHRMAGLMSRHSPHPVWYYEFSYVGQLSHYVDPVTKKPIGAMHHDDLIYLFSLSYAFPTIAPASPDSPLVDKMTALWYNFARYGDPNPRGDTPELTSLSWPAMTPTDRKYLRIDKEFLVHENLFEDRFKVPLTSRLVIEDGKQRQMAVSWWREPAGPDDDESGDNASRMWRSACGTLMAPTTEEAWKKIEDHSQPETVWHSLRNCVAHQAGVWQNLLRKGMDDVIQPAAFKLAIVLRHTPPDLTAGLLADLLHLHPQSQDLTSYVLALLTDDEAGCGNCIPAGENSPASPAPLRDLQLFGDCELAVLAAPVEQYDAHAKLVRAEYAKMSQETYIELRIRVLNNFSQIPRVFHTPEFEHLERAARDNIERELRDLREELLTGHGK